MKPIVKKSILLTLVYLLLIPASMLYAHGMFLTLEESGVLKVEYDGGGFSPRTEITIYDDKKSELGKGLVDEEGKYHFDKNLHVHSAIAEDGMGHRAEYKEGVETKTVSKVPVVIGVFAAVGVIFAIYNKKSKQKIK